MMKSLVNGMRSILYIHLHPISNISIILNRNLTTLPSLASHQRSITPHPSPTTIMLRTILRTATLRPLQQTIRLSSTTSNSEPLQTKTRTSEQKKPQDEEKPAPKKKTMAELDEELRQKMSGLAGDGGEAGVELEGGQVRLINYLNMSSGLLLLTFCDY